MAKKNEKKEKVEEVVRRVTEADFDADPRLQDAGVAVGQLYDFSNLEVLPKGASFTEESVKEVNEKKADANRAVEERADRLNNTEATTAAEKVALRDAQVAEAARVATK